MIRGATPDITLTVGPDTLELPQASSVFVTVTHMGRTITKTGSDLQVSGNSIEFSFTEEESLSLPEGDGEIQVNWRPTTGKRGTSVVGVLPIRKQIYMEVLP